jgi:hypothetical protein
MTTTTVLCKEGRREEDAGERECRINGVMRSVDEEVVAGKGNK